MRRRVAGPERGVSKTVRAIPPPSPVRKNSTASLLLLFIRLSPCFVIRLCLEQSCDHNRCQASHASPARSDRCEDFVTLWRTHSCVPCRHSCRRLALSHHWLRRHCGAAILAASPLFQRAQPGAARSGRAAARPLVAALLLSGAGAFACQRLGPGFLHLPPASPSERKTVAHARKPWEARMCSRSEERRAGTDQ